MRLRLTVAALVVLALAVGAAAVTPSEAQAYSGPPPQQLLEAWTDLTFPALREPPSAEATASDPAKTLLWRARVATGAMPALRVLGVVGLGATALGTGWKIGRAIDTQFLHLSGTASMGTTATAGTTVRVAPIEWEYKTAGTNVSGFLTPYEGWYLHWYECSGSGCTPTAHSRVFTPDAAVAGVLAGAVAMGTQVIATNNSAVGFWFASADTFDRHLTVDTSEPYTSQSYDHTTDMTAPGDPGASSDAAETARGILMEGDDATDAEIGTIIDPSYDGPDATPGTQTQTLRLPKPGVNETYTEYLARLRLLGWLGTATTTEATGVATEAGPLAALKLSVTDATLLTTRVFVPFTTPGSGEESWPDPAAEGQPEIDPESDITVEFNPGTATAVPLPAPGGDGSSCDCPPPDFSPLTSIDYGDAFPFGMFTWMGDVLGVFTVGPDAPSFTFAFHDVHTPVGTYDLGEGTVDLEVMDDYVAIMRTLISWAMWIGAVWWVAANLLGFRAAGDVGETVDEVI